MRKLLPLLLLCCWAAAPSAQSVPDCTPAKKGGRWGCVDAARRPAIPFDYDVLLQPAAGGPAPAKKTGRWGLAWPGAEFRQLRYDEIYVFSEGLARVRLGKRYGFIDEQGREALPPVYEEAFAFSGGFTTARLDGNYGFLNRATLIFKPKPFVGIGRYSGGLAPAQALEAEERCGYIDAEGKVTIPFEYALCSPFDEGFAPAMKDLKGGWGYLSAGGKALTPFKYTKAGPFRNGKAEVEVKGARFILGPDGKETPLK